MKTRILTLALMLLAAIGTTQADDHKRPSMQKMQINRSARLVTELGLDDATAAKFTAVYTQATNEMREARDKYARVRPQRDENGQVKPLTDAQIKANIENQFALTQATLDIRRKYYAEYCKILTPRQIQKLYEMEKKSADYLSKMPKGNFPHKRRPQDDKKPTPRRR